ncbi:unnamed protein product [Allacma fusca]|uniref:Uncharacterized protein n=1 Tax=Allacma fusca TaxID=39272 RepID=A0A8J2L7H8_9HEXA|nr:unnamed protein product [Allacma fusca]
MEVEDVNVLLVRMNSVFIQTSELATNIKLLELRNWVSGSGNYLHNFLFLKENCCRVFRLSTTIIST